jgi:uncharacterized protein
MSGVLHLAPVTEFKFASDETGAFEGYGAIFGNVDLGGDLIKPGAFKASLKAWRAQKNLPPMLFDHGMQDRIPVGQWTEMDEDEKGLKVQGRLIAGDTEVGKRLHAAMKVGGLTGMSIGYRAVEYAFGTKPGDPYRTLKAVDLVELSIVTFPMNPEARVSRVKAADIVSKQEFEKALRDAGFSKSEAALMASKTTLPARRDAVGDEGGVIAALHKLTQAMKG